MYIDIKLLPCWYRIIFLKQYIITTFILHKMVSENLNTNTINIATLLDNFKTILSAK